MKANELMIGDYIEHIEGSNPIQIEEIHTDGVIFSDVCYLPYDEIKPIPLTAEILEKNGFLEFIPHNWQIVIDNVMIELREPEHNMAIWLDWEKHDTGTYASYMLPGPNCVHELQQALRLCNIDEKIEL